MLCLDMTASRVDFGKFHFCVVSERHDGKFSSPTLRDPSEGGLEYMTLQTGGVQCMNHLVILAAG